MIPTKRVRAREAALWLAFSWLAITIVPFRRIAPRLGSRGSESPPSISPEAALRAREVQLAIANACSFLHWRPTCLVRSLAAVIMLRRRRLDSTLYLATALRENGLEAHAFVRCGEVYVAGGSERKKYTVLSSFSRG